MGHSRTVRSASFRRAFFGGFFSRIAFPREKRRRGRPKKVRTSATQTTTISHSKENRHVGNLKGTQTEKNLLTAFAGESQARNRYTYFAKQAKKEGYVQIAGIFEETANQEKEHAKRLFKFLEGGEGRDFGRLPGGCHRQVPSTISRNRPPAKTTSTPRCIRDLQRWPGRRGSRP